MRILRLSVPEQTRLEKSAQFLKIDETVLLNLLVKNQLDYLEQQENEYNDNPSPCLKVELAGLIGIRD